MMMRQALSLITLLIITISCGTNPTTKAILEKKKQVGDVPNHETMSERINKIFNESAHLDDQQKEKFFQIHGEIVSQAQEINGKIRKLKIVLIKEIASEEYNAKKVNAITRRLRKHYLLKMDLMSEGLHKIRKELGAETLHFISNDDWSLEHLDRASVPQKYFNPTHLTPQEK